MSDVRHLVVVSDLHCGSGVAVCPGEVQLDERSKHIPSPVQNKLHSWWLEFWNEWVPYATGGEPYSVVVNGDLIEGRHHLAIDPFTLNLAIQSRVARELLKPVRAKAVNMLLVRGTEVHDGKACEQLETLGELLGVDQIDGNYSTYKLVLDFCGHTIHFDHHIGVTQSAAYETSALNRALVKEFVEAGRWGGKVADWQVRSHRHQSCGIWMPSARGRCGVVVTPSWQALTAFGHKVATGSRPQIGGIVMTAEPWGDLEIRNRIWALENPPSVTIGKVTKSTGIVSLANLPRRRAKASPSPKSRTGSTSVQPRRAKRSGSKS